MEPRVAACTSWLEQRIVCDMPPGVVPAGVVTVIAASSRRSHSGTTTVAYRPPTIDGIEVLPGPHDRSSPLSEVLLSTTRGGGLLTLRGVNLGSPTLPVSVWLVRGGVTPTPPWRDAWLSGSADGLLQCVLVQGSGTPTNASCVVPEGGGALWRVLVVNHDLPVEVAGAPPGALSSLRWRTSLSSASGRLLSYRPPNITNIALIIESHHRLSCQAAAVAVSLLHPLRRLLEVSSCVLPARTSPRKPRQ